MERKRIDEVKALKVKRQPSGAAVIKEEKTRQLEKALFEEWAATGYAAMNMENIARRAGVGKAALYRRWGAKFEMVSDVLPRVGIKLSRAKDTGSLHGDLTLMLRYLRALLRHRLVQNILPDIHAEMLRNPPLAAIVRTELQTGRRAQAELLFQRAVTRAELPADIDVDIACNLVGALVYWRLIVTHQRADNHWLEQLTKLIIQGLGGQKTTPSQNPA